MDGKAMASALLTSFNALVAVATPDRVVPVLRHALTTLLAEEPAPKPSKKNRTRWVGDIATWAPLRERILATLMRRQMSRRELAETLEISFPTLRPSLLPTGPAPSRANLARLRNWLGTVEAASDANGLDHAGHSNGDSNGQAGPLIVLSRRLTRDQRARLAGYAEFDGRALRKSAGVGGDLIEQAIAGGDLGPEVYERLLGFLDEKQPAAPGP